MMARRVGRNNSAIYFSAWSIPTPKNRESILFSDFQAKESILGQESIIFISMES